MEDPTEMIRHAPLPTARTLRARGNLALQMWRFLVLNVKMVKMIRKGHHPMERKK